MVILQIEYAICGYLGNPRHRITTSWQVDRLVAFYSLICIQIDRTLGLGMGRKLTYLSESKFAFPSQLLQKIFIQKLQIELSD